MNCLDCAKGLGRQNKTGYCISCGNTRRNADPVWRQRHRAAMEKVWRDPAHRAKMQAVAIRMGIKARQNPEFREWQRENGKRLIRDVLSRPDIAAKANSPEAKARAVAAKRASAIAWCPPEYRDDYFFLLRIKRLPAADVREFIETQIKADIAKLSPFERQDRAMAKGAALVANDSGPSFGEATDYGEARWTA